MAEVYEAKLKVEAAPLAAYWANEEHLVFQNLSLLVVAVFVGHSSVFSFHRLVYEDFRHRKEAVEARFFRKERFHWHDRCAPSVQRPLKLPGWTC